MILVLFYSFLAYTLLSWVLLFRDSWTIEVLQQKFYPSFAVNIAQIQTFLSNFKLNTIPTVLFLLFAVTAFLAYFLSWKKKYSPKKIFLMSLIFQIIVFFSYPILSTDVLSYILSDRIDVVYHQNVWKTKPNVFVNDPYYFLVYPIFKDSDWTNQTRIYGPVNQVIYSTVTKLSGNDLFANLASRKLVILFFNLATMALVYKILKKYYPNKLSFGLLFIFWNPLFILETVGSGHNDIIMIFFLMLSYFFFLKKSPILVAISLALAANVKFTAMFLAPLYLTSFLGQKISASVKFGIIFLLAYLGLFATTGISFLSQVSRTAYSTTLYWQSFPQQLVRIFPFGLRLLNPIFALFYGFLCLKAWLGKKDPLVLYGLAYFFYLLFAVGAYWNWYSLWILTAFVFLGNGPLTKMAAAYTFTSILAYPLYWLSLRFNYQHFLWPVIIYLVILSGPFVVFAKDIISRHSGAKEVKR